MRVRVTNLEFRVRNHGKRETGHQTEGKVRTFAITVLAEVGAGASMRDKGRPVWTRTRRKCEPAHLRIVVGVLDKQEIADDVGLATAGAATDLCPANTALVTVATS